MILQTTPDYVIHAKSQRAIVLFQYGSPECLTYKTHMAPNTCHGLKSMLRNLYLDGWMLRICFVKSRKKFASENLADVLTQTMQPDNPPTPSHQPIKANTLAAEVLEWPVNSSSKPLLNITIWIIYEE